MTIIANPIYDAVFKFLINEPAPFIESLPLTVSSCRKNKSNNISTPNIILWF